MQILKIYDNEGETFDRYTVVTNEHYNGKFECLGLSTNPDNPQGFSMWCICVLGEHLGKEIAFEDLPLNVQEHITRRLAE